MQFCKKALSSIPKILGEEDGPAAGASRKLFLPEQLSEPIRSKFKLTTADSPMDILATLIRLREDPSLEQDLSGFEAHFDPPDAEFRMPPYIS
jgi:hypothetical protein